MGELDLDPIIQQVLADLDLASLVNEVVGEMQMSSVVMQATGGMTSDVLGEVRNRSADGDALVETHRRQGVASTARPSCHPASGHAEDGSHRHDRRPTTNVSRTPTARA